MDTSRTLWEALLPAEHDKACHREDSHGSPRHPPSRDEEIGGDSATKKGHGHPQSFMRLEMQRSSPSFAQPGRTWGFRATTGATSARIWPDMLRPGARTERWALWEEQPPQWQEEEKMHRAKTRGSSRVPAISVRCPAKKQYHKQPVSWSSPGKRRTPHLQKDDSPGNGLSVRLRGSVLKTAVSFYPPPIICLGSQVMIPGKKEQMTSTSMMIRRG